MNEMSEKILNEIVSIVVVCVGQPVAAFLFSLVTEHGRARREGGGVKDDWTAGKNEQL